MQINSQQTYAASPERVYAMMTDETYLGSVCDRFGATDRTITVDGSNTTVKMSLPAPPQVQKFVGATLPLNQFISWGEPAADGSRTGTMRMTVDRMPVHVEGSATLTPVGENTEVRYSAEMDVKIPLVGRKLEKEAAPMVQKALDVQQQVGEMYLAENA